MIYLIGKFVWRISLRLARQKKMNVNTQSTALHRTADRSYKRSLQPHSKVMVKGIVRFRCAFSLDSLVQPAWGLRPSVLGTVKLRPFILSSLEITLTTPSYLILDIVLLRYARDNGFLLMETSSRTGCNVKELFGAIASELAHKTPRKQLQKQLQSVQLFQPRPQKNEKDSCC